MTTGWMDSIFASRLPKLAELTERIDEALRSVGKNRKASKITVSVFCYDERGQLIEQKSSTLNLANGEVMGDKRRRKPKATVRPAGADTAYHAMS